jgi:hypothetical protein
VWHGIGTFVYKGFVPAVLSLVPGIWIERRQELAAMPLSSNLDFFVGDV